MSLVDASARFEAVWGERVLLAAFLAALARLFLGSFLTAFLGASLFG